METAISARTGSIFDRYRTRLVAGALFSLALHAFILSLRLGIPGLGLPGLELPWSERRAQLPVLAVRIARQASVPNEEPAPRLASTPPKPQPPRQQSVASHLPADLSDARTRQTPQRSAVVALQKSRALQATPGLGRSERKQGSPPPDDQANAMPARAQTKLLALDGNRPSDFTVPTADLDDWWHSAPVPDSTPVPLPPTETAAPPAIALRTPKPPLETAQEPAPAVQKPTEQESFERPDQIQASQPESKIAPDVALEQAAKAQGEEILKQEAARMLEEQQAAQRAQDLENKKQEEARQHEAEEAARLLAAQKLEEEKTAKLAEELAAKKQEEIRQAELAEAERQAKELEARRQAEEITRRQAAALALQKQQEEEQRQEEETAKAEQAKARQQQQREAMELARKQAEEAAQLAAQAESAAKAAAAERERENAALAAAASAAAGKNVGGNGANSSGAAGRSGSLAANALEQVGKIAAAPSAPVFAAAPAREEPNNTSRRSIFGSFDHDINLAMYKISWRAKIERNGDLNYSQSSRDKKRTDPVVTVAIRSDGSVENIEINRSSGVPDLDEAVRRIVRVNANYGVFPSGLARKYDVIEIRTVWNFEDKLRLHEEIVSE